MRKVAASLMGIAVSTSPAFGGVVTFDPPSVVVTGEQVQFAVGVAVESLAAFDAADLLVGSMHVQIVSFEYSQEWDDVNPFPLLTPGPQGIWPSDVSFGGFLLSKIDSHANIGTLTIGTAGLAPGIYEFGVDSAFDGGFSKLTRGLEDEPLLGWATVYAGVPEPATLALLVLGGLITLRRRYRDQA